MMRVVGRAAVAATLLALLVPGALFTVPPASASQRTDFPAEWVLDPTTPDATRVLSWPPSRLRFPSTGLPLAVALSSSEGLSFPLDSPVSIRSDIFEIAPPTLPPGEYTLEWRDARGAWESMFTVSDNAPPGSAVASSAGSARSPLTAWAFVVLPAAALAVLALILALRRRWLAAAVLLGVALFAPAAWALLLANEGESDFAAECLLSSSRDSCLSGVMVNEFQSSGAPAVSSLLARLTQDPRFSGSRGDHPCHEAAHQAGQMLVESGVPLDVLVREDLAGCSTGLVHGAVEGWAPLVGADELVASFDGVCSALSSPWSLEECWHGLGHAAGLRFGSRPLPSLGACESLSVEKAAALCAQGAGMQMATTFMVGLSLNGGVNTYWLPEGLTAAPPKACVTLDAPSARAMCFAGAFTYLNFGYYGGSSGPAPSALPDEAHPDRMALWCSGLAEADRLSCWFGLGVGLADPAGPGPYDDKAAACAVVASPDGRSWCAAGVVVNSVQDGLRQLSDVSDDVRARVCAAAAAPPDCLAGQRLERGWSLILPESSSSLSGSSSLRPS